MIDGQVVQIVTPSLTIPVPVHDLRSRPEHADQLASEEARAPFVLSKAPLLRASLLRIADDEDTLLITIHHIISDGWSIGVITDELGQIYEAFHRGQESPLPELPIQYADYTIWEQQNRSEESLAEGEAYWKEQLTGLPQFEVMPDGQRSPTSVATGNICSRLLPTQLTDSLRDFSRKQNSTLFMMMLAALTTLLHRYTGETDIVTGSQVVGRNSVEIESLIGPFINTLVLRTDASGDPTFPELLSRVRQMVTDALAHQDVPLERVAEILRLERSADRNLLFQVNFIYQRDFVHPWNYAGVSMRPIPSKSPGAIHDLNIFLVERAEGWRASCEYNTSLFSEFRIQRLLEHYERLLNAILANPRQRISRFRFMGQEEETQLLNAWNQTYTEYPRKQCVHELFEAQARATPESVAVVCGGESLTYRELNQKANQLARYLRDRDIVADTLAGVCVDRSLNMLIAVLAVLKAGAAYVPLDPSFPAERLAFMAEDSGMRLLITERAHADLIQTSVPRICLDFQREEIAKEETANLNDESSPDRLAYVIYTSGSTGKPKGVEIHHQAAVNLLYAILEKPGLNSRDSLLAITTLSFDIAGLELFAPLLTGARIILATREQASDGIALRNLLNSSHATVLQATPATWRMLIDAGWRDTPTLKMLCGGEPLPRDLADALLDRGGELWNMYGPTETTIWSSWCRVQRDAQPITIGKPAANTLFYVLDTHLQPVPVGVPGELFIGGEGVGKGYHNRLELTAEKFITNPFGSGRLYRTGDRARYKPDGTVEMLGRMDTQVKIRGFRIELGEVEGALSACSQVRHAAVVVREDGSGQKVLAGYFVPAEASEQIADAVRKQLKERLPEYMVPTFLVPLPRLPQTPNGKVDRKALPAPDAVRAEAPAADAAPQDQLELMLIGIWESVLKVKPIGRNDNFFEIGGHSVLAARMFARMEAVIGKALPLATLFQGPTVAKLASLLRDSGWTPPWSSLVPIRPSGTKPPFFFVHPIGGNVLNFAGFASHFGSEQPVYGLQARGLDGQETPSIAVERMAADYIGEIRAVQPDGPYYIGGFSAGGIVAFEMARQLQWSGHKVAVLALLDTKVDGSPQSSLAVTGNAIGRWIRTVRFNLRYVFHTGLTEFTRQKIKNWKMRARIRAWSIKNAMGQTADARGLDVEEAFLVALRRYNPQQYDGDAILFRAKNELVRYPDPTLGWGALIQGNLDIKEISGDHDTILYEPHIGMLARVLDSCLEAAQRDRSKTMGAIQQSA